MRGSMRRAGRFWAWAPAVVVLFTEVPAVWAQKVATLPKQDRGILQWVIAIAAAGFICAAAFMNPKRTHLD